MNTPICDFLKKYSNEKTCRFHMPGHKGAYFMGPEKYDITEIKGADSLFEAQGIIRESEKNAGEIFGSDTFYSTEGSSLCIRAMLFLCIQYAKKINKKAVLWACRNAHKTFLNTAALLQFDIKWLFGDSKDNYLSCAVNAEKLENSFKKEKELPVAVYLTSPDYLGSVSDIKKIADVCRKHGVLLVVDNAHGSYLKFLKKSLHPIDLGADLCCDSAHKTLPVLTGGAYMHLSKRLPPFFKENAKKAMALFASTSPSYLILNSLDMANVYLKDSFKKELEIFLPKVEALKKSFKEKGFEIIGDEPLKITISTKKYGFLGHEFSDELLKNNVMCEFSDPDYTVIMLTPKNTDEDLQTLLFALDKIAKRPPLREKPPIISEPKKAMGIREAFFSLTEEIEIDKSEGRILADAYVSCPPAVPIVVCGEVVDKEALECFKYYNIEKCTVVKE